MAGLYLPVPDMPPPTLPDDDDFSALSSSLPFTLLERLSSNLSDNIVWPLDVSYSS
jgi:hypothetical protein